MSRRAFGGLGAAAVAAYLSGCSSYDEGKPKRKSTRDEPWQPVNVDHAYGTTEITKEPLTIVSAGLTDQDFLLSLGILPVAVTDWYGDQPYATWPWAQDALGDSEPEVLNTNDGFQYTRMKSLVPDLIVACNSGATRKDYVGLTEVAPTIVHPAGVPSVFASWKDIMPLIGQALDLEDRATEVTDSVLGRFSEAREANPRFEGKKAIFLQNAVSDGSLIAYQDGLATDFLTDLGFEVPAELDEFVSGESQAYIPVERIDVLDAADVLIWGTENDKDRAALEKVPGFSGLRAVAQGASIYTGAELAAAIYFTSPLSLPYVVDKLVPMIAEIDV